MVNTKKINLNNIFLFLFLIIFPFGQIIRIGVLQPIDVVAALGGLYAIIRNFKRPKSFLYFENFLIIALATWIYSILLFKNLEVLFGLLYLFRIAAYFYFFIYVWNFVREKLSNKELVINSLLLVTVVSGVFGWVQYFIIPSLIPFFTWGWDEHLYRLVGTFLDPTFLGLILVFGILTSFYMFLTKRKKVYIPIIIFLLVSLAFTYSRGSYLALLVGLISYALFKRKIKQIILIILTLVILIFLLPTSGNHVLRITREFSVIARIDNYLETIKVFEKSPVFGIGYNNLCLAKNEFIKFESTSSHSCSGSDSSLLMVLATTGVVGTIILIVLGAKIWTESSDFYKIMMVSLLVHSLFSNSMFYSWVLGFVLVLFAAHEKLRVEG